MRIVLTCIAFLVILCSVSLAALPDELVLYMPFDSNTASDKIVRDMSKYGNNGTVIGTPKIVAGHKGEAMDFNGTTDTIEILTSESLAKTANRMSLVAWVFPRTDTQVEIITKWDGTLNGVIHFELVAGGIVRFTMRRAEAAADAMITDSRTTAGKFTINKWTHIAETYDGTTARVYVNGEEVLNVACTGVMRDNKDMKWWIGSLYGSQGRWFNGLIDEVYIWSKALSVDEIKKSMESTIVTSVEKTNKLATSWGSIKY